MTNLTKKPKSLVVVLNETRGSDATLRPLLDTGLSNLDWTLAFCGAKKTGGDNPYGQIAEYLWEFDEPENWLLELEILLPKALFRFFLDVTNNQGISMTPQQIQLWVSAWIQNIYRVRALETIVELDLDKQYDFIFFVRSDYLFTSPITPPTAKSSPGLLFMSGDSYGGVNDRFLGVPTSLVPSLGQALDYRTEAYVGSKLQLFDFLRKQRSQNPETVLWYQLEKGGFFVNAHFVGQMGFCIRVAGESSRWSSGYWWEKKALYVKYPTELLLSNWNISKRWKKRTQGLLNLKTRLVRVAGTQPRLLLAPLLVAEGEGELAKEVFLNSPRESASLAIQIPRDVLSLIVDLTLFLSGRRRWQTRL